MDVKEIVMLVTFIICFIILFLNEYIFKSQNNNIKEKIYQNNKRLIFVNNDTMDIKEENYKSKDFFRMRNGGDLEINNFKYITYSNKEEYYL